MTSNPGTRRRVVSALVAVALTLMAAATGPATAEPAVSSVAPDATAPGPLATTSAEYRFPAGVDPDVLGDRATEIWARVYRPQTMGSAPRPVVLFLHGNHSTCGYGANPRIDDSVQYSITGTCPANHVVVPNHDGYGYLASQLASWGYVAVSINANRGLNGSPGVDGDMGLNLARGRLVLKHLQLLSTWNTSGGTPPALGVDLRGTLDLGQVGLFGHSRGGEGMRAAYNLYRDADSPWPARIPDQLTFRGIFEVAPVDGQTGRVLDAPGTPWGVLLPMCDGDLLELPGVRPFDRMQRLTGEAPTAFKATYTVWGANHNYYNTEWQESDSPGCAGHDPLWTSTVGSPAQRTTGIASVLAFFLGNVGAARPEFNRNFDPSFALPSSVSTLTRVDRGFTPSPGTAVTKVVENFDKPTGTNSYGHPNNAANVTVAHGPVPDHDRALPAATLTWTSPGPSTYFQTNWTEEGKAINISPYRTLDLRVARPVNDLNPTGTTTFTIRLVHGDGTLSAPVSLARHASLTGPVGVLDEGGKPQPHAILQTVRVPLTEFGTDLARGVRGVRMTFDETPSGAIHVAGIRLSKQKDLPSTPAPVTGPTATKYQQTPGKPPEVGTVVGIHHLPTTSADRQANVAIAVTTPAGFPVRDELVELRIGPRAIHRSAYTRSDLSELTFTLTPEEWNATRTGDPMTVGYGRQTVTTLGKLDKAALDR